MRKQVFRDVLQIVSRLTEFLFFKHSAVKAIKIEPTTVVSNMIEVSAL